MIRTEEQRRAQRYNVRLPLLIVRAGGLAVNCSGQTRDLGAGGVRFVIPAELPAGTAIDYVVTLSNYTPAALIRCTGVVLRCMDNADGRPNSRYEIAATMRSYVFVPLTHKETMASECLHNVDPGQSTGQPWA